jgi:RHH-type transcriptional regulator, proline utilization regulon repressor / proline dehydrogenase / delta 1-pyrroline-5-carboxylate dehydrogenase
MENSPNTCLNADETEQILKESLVLAETWQNRATALLTHEEKVIQQRLMRLLNHPTDKAVLTRLIDQSFRSADNRRVADQVCWLLKKYGVPTYFPLSERFLARLFCLVGCKVPDWAVPKMVEKMRSDSSRTIIHGEAEAFLAHMAKRKAEGVRMNINHLGETVLGEAEALNRLAKYVETLESPEVEYISVKISTIYSQISSIGIDHSVAGLK